MPRTLAVLLAIPLALSAVPVARQETIDAATLERITREAMDRSQVHRTFTHFVDTIGPRLTASPAYKAAADWSREQLTNWGMTSARLEAWEFGRGWQLEHFTLDMVEPRYMPLIAYPEGWSASMSGEITATPVYAGGVSGQDLEAMRDTLKGAIVLAHPAQTSFVREDRGQPTDPGYVAPPPAQRGGSTALTAGGSTALTAGGSTALTAGGSTALTAGGSTALTAGGSTALTAGGSTALTAGQTQGGRGRGQGRGGTPAQQVLREAGPAVVLRTSRGEHGTMFVLGRDQRANALPSVIVAGEHYNMLVRMVTAGLPVKVRVNLKTRYLEADRNGYNVVAEIPGQHATLKDEVVMIGAHLDSWHSAPGATDNADGAAVVLEAMRILSAIGVKPHRTIRVALWGGEEQGLLGSREYVRRHLAGDGNAAARERFSVYFNIDPGAGPIYGWFLQGQANARAIMDGWLAPLTKVGARKNVPDTIGNTDHLSFTDIGLPAFNPIQDYVDYDVRTHHTNVDTYERVREADLKQAAIVMATFAYHAAMRTERFPRP